jgi:hypothetical protein
MRKKTTKIKPKSKFNDKISDEEFLQVWEKISKKLGYKFKFGYHSHEDMRQQAAIFALEGLKNYDHKRPLENFLWTHVRNRLFNYKRDNYQRPDKPCLTCPFHNPDSASCISNCTEFTNKNDCSLYSSWLIRNENKKNIMRPIGIDSISEEITRDDLLKNISNKEIIQLIDKNISIKNRPIFLKLLGGMKVPKIEIKKLLKEIQQILNNNDIDPTT